MANDIWSFSTNRCVELTEADMLFAQVNFDAKAAKDALKRLTFGRRSAYLNPCSFCRIQIWVAQSLARYVTDDHEEEYIACMACAKTHHTEGTCEVCGDQFIRAYKE